MGKVSLLLQKKPVNEEEISEAFARERRKVNGGHQASVPFSWNNAPFKVGQTGVLSKF